MNETIFYYIVHPLIAMVACMGYAIVCNAPRKEVPYGGMAAFICWLTYQLVTRNGGTAFMGTLLATCAATSFARILSCQRKLPTIVYHLPGILPLVPGAAVYHCITSAMDGGAFDTTLNILTAFKLAGAIGIGSVIILVLPTKWFNIIPHLSRKDA